MATITKTKAHGTEANQAYFDSIAKLLKAPLIEGSREITGKNIEVSLQSPIVSLEGLNFTSMVNTAGTILHAVTPRGMMVMSESLILGFGEQQKFTEVHSGLGSLMSLKVRDNRLNAYVVQPQVWGDSLAGLVLGYACLARMVWLKVNQGVDQGVFKKEIVEKIKSVEWGSLYFTATSFVVYEENEDALKSNMKEIDSPLVDYSFAQPYSAEEKNLNGKPKKPKPWDTLEGFADFLLSLSERQTNEGMRKYLGTLEVNHG